MKNGELGKRSNSAILHFTFFIFNLLLGSAAFGYTSADYVQDGLIGHWDGIENAGVGIHSSTTNIWKDLVGDCDLTLTANGSWSGAGNALTVSGQSAAAATASPTYKTIEIVYRMTTAGGRILFSRGGDTKRIVCFDASGTKGYFDGRSPKAATKCVAWTFDASARRSMTGIYDDSDTVTSVYGDGELRDDGTNANNWNAGTVMSIGDRYANSYPWYGEVYAIRLYSTVLTAEQIAANHAIDEARFGSCIISGDPEASAATSSSVLASAALSGGLECGFKTAVASAASALSSRSSGAMITVY